MSPPALRAVRSAADNEAAPPPHNIEAEQALLGALLTNNATYYKFFEILTPDDFYDPVHGEIYDAAAKTIDAGRVADPRTLRAQFENREEFRAVGGGANYLIDLAANVVTVFNTEDYARLIHDLYLRRQLIAFANQVKGLAHTHEAPPEAEGNLVGAVETMLYALAERRERGAAKSAKEVLAKTLAKIEEAYKNGRPMGILTGFPDLDDATGGLQKGKVYVLAGRPSMGKTAAGLTTAINVARTGYNVLFNTLEMPDEDIGFRIIARATGIPADRQLGKISQDEINKIFAVKAEMESLPIFIDDSAGIDVGKIRGRTIREKRRHGIDLLIIDYLGLIKRNPKLQNTNYQIEEITNSLKVLAKELNIPILLLCQLSREVEKREDRRPTLADLRDSGSIEQDADVVMFLYRHEYYLTREEPQQKPRESDQDFNDRYAKWEHAVEKSRGKAELIIAKNRQGRCRTVKLRFIGMKCLFESDQTNEGGDEQ